MDCLATTPPHPAASGMRLMRARAAIRGGFSFLSYRWHLHGHHAACQRSSAIPIHIVPPSGRSGLIAPPVLFYHEVFCLLRIAFLATLEAAGSGGWPWLFVAIRSWRRISTIFCLSSFETVGFAPALIGGFTLGLFFDYLPTSTSCQEAVGTTARDHPQAA